MHHAEGIYIEGVGRRAVEDALAALGASWRIREQLAFAGGVGWVVVPTDNRHAPVSDAFRLAYQLRARWAERHALTVEPLVEEEPDVDVVESSLASDPADVPAGWHLAFARVPQASAAGVRVGHPDTGYTDHPAIAAMLNIAEGYDYVDGGVARDEREVGPMLFPGHGTRTASVLGGSWNGEPPNLTGVAPGVELLPIRVSRSVIVLSQYKLARAIRHAVERGCRVISISMGGLPHTLLRRACEEAAARGTIVACAAGNRVGTVVWPARYPSTIAAAACTHEGTRWSGSSHGPAVDITAPGHAIRVASWDHDEATTAVSSGTSYAVAMTAGAAALWIAQHGWDDLWARYGSAIPVAFRHVLRTSARPHQLDGMGAGFLDVERVLSQTLPAPSELGAEESVTSDAFVDAFGPGAAPDVAAALHTDAAGLDAALDDIGDELLYLVLTVDGAERALRERRLAELLLPFATEHLSARLRGAPPAVVTGGRSVSVTLPLTIHVSLGKPRVD